MFIRRTLITLVYVSGVVFSPVYGQQSSNKAVADLGRENAQLAHRAGVWDVKESVWDSPGATPTITIWEAERTMV